MTAYRVTSIGLNVRYSPSATVRDNLFQPPLLHGEIVEQVGASPDGQWFRIHAKQGRIIREGWVAAKYLAPVAEQFVAVQPLADEPAWMEIARHEIGGRKDKPDHARIGDYLATALNRMTEQTRTDRKNWSSAFVNWCLKQAGYEGTHSNSPRSWWDSWHGGMKSAEPFYGSIAVFRTLTEGIDLGQGYVGFFVRADGSKIYVLGGNQEGGVDIKPYQQKDLIGYIYPHSLPPTPASVNEEAVAAPNPDATFLTLLPSGRLAEASLDERQARIARLKAQLSADKTETPAARERLEAQISDGEQEYGQAQARWRYSAPVPIPDATDAGPTLNWRKAWSWTTTDFKGLYIADANAPFNNANFRNKPGEVQGSNVERVVAFLDAENNPRYAQQGDSTFCTVFVYDATWLLSVEIPIAPNRAANRMCDWLASTPAHARGWRRLASVTEAQQNANRGAVVIATQRRSIAGHVALVRPVPLDKMPLQNNAYSAQAGAVNASLTTVADIFGDPATVTFYMHI